MDKLLEMDDILVVHILALLLHHGRALQIFQVVVDIVEDVVDEVADIGSTCGYFHIQQLHAYI